MFALLVFQYGYFESKYGNQMYPERGYTGNQRADRVPQAAHLPSTGEPKHGELSAGGDEADPGDSG